MSPKTPIIDLSDVIVVLTDSARPRQTIKKMRCRVPALDVKGGTICTPLRCWLQMASSARRIAPTPMAKAGKKVVSNANFLPAPTVSAKPKLRAKPPKGGMV